MMENAAQLAQEVPEALERTANPGVRDLEALPGAMAQLGRKGTKEIKESRVLSVHRVQHQQ
jgi:hypothetical protein